MIHQLFQKSDASGSKSTILKPLTWFISLLLAAIIALSYTKANSWLIVFLVILISIAFIVFIMAYIYCLFKNPDALRSETFSIQKMAIEKGVFGDNISGTFLLEDKSEISNIEKNSKDEKGSKSVKGEVKK